MSHAEIIARARRLQEFYADPAVQSLFAELAAANHNAWLAAKSTDEREMAWAQATMLAALQSRMKVHIARGEVAKVELGRPAAPGQQ